MRIYERVMATVVACVLLGVVCPHMASAESSVAEQASWFKKKKKKKPEQEEKSKR